MQSESLLHGAGVSAVDGVLAAGPLMFRTLNCDVLRTTETETNPQQSATADIPSLVEAAREEGRREAAARLQQDLERRIERERSQVGSALDAFMAEKRKYFAGLEKEVVRLALAIAERVLHRETAMDPTLLAGAARVVLEQVDQDSAATLLVAAGEAQQWRAALATLGRDVEVREESTLQHGECLLQTASGSFELGVRQQLCEIERGFFELLGRSSAVTA